MSRALDVVTLTGEEYDDLMDWGFEPTHWMPLPTPPES